MGAGRKNMYLQNSLKNYYPLILFISVDKESILSTKTTVSTVSTDILTKGGKNHGKVQSQTIPGRVV